MKAKPIPLKVRQQVWERSSLKCEACGLDRAAVIHHRKLRSQGGDHDLSNLLHCSYPCHAKIHANVAESYARGLLVRRADIPALIPVHMYEVA